MSKAKTTQDQAPVLNRREDIFAALTGDVPLRDDTENMTMPLVSLSKNKRTLPIEWRSADGKRSITVSGSATHGIATIWDYDIILWAISQLNAAVEAGRPVSDALSFHPHDLLKAIGRGVSGRDYMELQAAVDRLMGTFVKATFRGERRTGRYRFHLLEQVEDTTESTEDEAAKKATMKIRLPRWMFEGVVQHRDVLQISPDYFALTSGVARWLYRLARRHAGKQATGWQFTMATLHKRSGSVQPLKEFARAVRRLVEVQGVPDYRLDLRRSETGEEVIWMGWDPARARPPRRKDMPKLELPTTPG